MRSLLQRLGLTGLVLTTIAVLMTISGLSNYAVAVTAHLADRAPVWLQIEREARLELAHPVPIEEIPALVARWGVRVDSFQHTYPATFRPVTMGAAIPPGGDVGQAAAQHRASAPQWVAARIARMEDLAGRVDAVGRASFDQNIHDLREVQAQLADGVRVSLVDVRASDARIQEILSDPHVRGVTWR